LEYCDEEYGTGLGDQKRRCRLEAGHLQKRHTDLPFLLHLKETYKKVADKIERDSLNTRGAPWPKNLAGVQKRRNRQPHWTLKQGDQLFPKHYADYETCLAVARRMTYYVYSMPNAPDCPREIVKYLEKEPVRNSYLCPICLEPVDFNDFHEAQQSKALIETAHLDPQSEYIHTPDNVCFAHRMCNIAQGDRSIEHFLEWIDGILQRHRSR
jgi:hypothetical protein